MPVLRFILLILLSTTQLYAANITLQTTIIYPQGIYPIKAKLIYELKNKNELSPESFYNGPIIHLEKLPTKFDAGNAPRFIFSSDDPSLNSRLQHHFYAAAPNGELYLSSAPVFNKNQNQYPVPKINRSYTQHELENWQLYPFMSEALRLALQARKQGNHPFGAVLVVNGKILKRAGNTVNTTKDFTAHAERNLETIGSKLSESIRHKSMLITSTEPCAMCAGGLVWTGVKTMVYGLPEEGLGEITGSDYFPVPSRKLLGLSKSPINIIGPVFPQIAALVHQGFWN